MFKYVISGFIGYKVISYFLDTKKERITYNIEKFDNYININDTIILTDFPYLLTYKLEENNKKKNRII